MPRSLPHPCHARTTRHPLSLLIFLIALHTWGCSPAPAEEGPLLIIPTGEEDMAVDQAQDEGGEDASMPLDAGRDAASMEGDGGVLDMEEDARAEEDFGEMGAPDLEQMPDMREPEDMHVDPADMGPAPVMFTELAATSVQQLFPGKQPGSMPASRTIRIFHSQELGVHVGLDERSGWTVAEVTQVFESLARFRRELPETYLPLFELSNQGETTWLRRPQQAPWTNTNLTGAFVILSDDFQSAGATMATNFYALGQANAQSVYGNVPFLNVRPEVIEGAFQGVGPRPIYPGLTAAQARDEYLKEGLADSLLHERLHAFISQFYAHDALFAELRDGTSCAYALEELLVRRHLTYLYMQHPDLFSAEHTRYWTQDLDLLSNQVEQSPCYVSFMNRGWLAQPLLHTLYVP